MDCKKSGLRSVKLNNENIFLCSSPVYSGENQETADCIFYYFCLALLIIYYFTNMSESCYFKHSEKCNSLLYLLARRGQEL